MKRAFNFIKNVFSGCTEKKKKLKNVRVLMVGLDAGGKTTILYSLKLGEVVTTIPTIGFNVETVKFGNMDLTLWDVGGEDKIRPLWRHYYEQTDGIFFVVDSNDRERLPEALDEFSRLIAREEQLVDAVFMVLWNKQDLPNAMSIDYGREKIYELPMAKENAIIVMPTVATTLTGVHEAVNLFQTLLEVNKKDRVRIVDALLNRLVWTPVNHMRFPKAHREKIWTLFLLAMKMDPVVIPLEIVYEIASFLPVETVET